MQHQQMQKKDGHMESQLNEQSEQLKEQIRQFEAKLKEQFEAKLNQHSEKQTDQFQEAVRQLSECHKVYTVTMYCTMIIIVGALM